MGCLAQILFFAGLLVAAVSAAPGRLEAPHPLAATQPHAPSTAIHEDTENAGHEEAQISEHHSHQAHGEQETPEHAAEEEHETESEPEHTFGAVHEAETEPEHTHETVHGSETEPEHTFTAHGADSEPEHVPEDAHATQNEDAHTTDAPLSPLHGHDAAEEEVHPVPPFGFKEHHESEDVLPDIPPAPHSAPTFGHH